MFECRSLCYQKGTKALIDCITQRFLPGKLYGVLGPNGAGKSTFLKCLSGIWQPTHGSVVWNGENLLTKERKVISRTVSLVQQNHSIPFDFTALELVRMGRYPHRQSLDEASAKTIQSAFELVDAWHLRNRPITQLSQGERQRIYIARSLVTESPILLLDEPTSYLDIRHHLDIWRLMRELANQGKIILVANHNLPATETFCDEIVLLDQGLCLGSGKFRELLTEARTQEVFGVEIQELAALF